MQSSSTKKVAAWLGISAVGLFGVALMVFALLNPNFNYLEDFVSKLGAIGQPYALWWNLIGFLAVGVLLAAFGLAFGRVVEDRIVGMLLIFFGIGFGATAVPVDMGDELAAVSKAHIVSICLALAAWLLGLARMAYLPKLGNSVHVMANIAAVLLVLPILGLAAGLWSMPVTHRLVFAVVFSWLAVTSIGLLRYREGTSNGDG